MQKIAIIGTGIAGLGAGYFLKDKYDVTFYEKNDYPGGHTHTLTVEEEGKPVFIDSAFMVYNEITYPHFVCLLNELGVKTKDTSMTFSVQHVPSGLEYCGAGLNGLFAQRNNLLSPRHWRMLLDMDRFNKESVKVLWSEQYLSYTMLDYAREEGYGQDFLEKFLIPISSAIWSAPPGQMLTFPVITLVRFFKNHGFLGLNTHYQWKTIVEGSQRYRDKILEHFNGKLRLSRGVQKVLRENSKAIVMDERGGGEIFDKVILAAHADQSLKMLADPTSDERRLLGCFKYQRNKATLHTDGSIMPKTKRAWSSWNYRITQHGIPTTIYYMNSLQHVSQKKDYFISINEAGEIDPGKIIRETVYEHPVYDVEAIKAQEELHRLNENGITYFCGSYFKYGFHEDALASALGVAGLMTGEGIRG